ncbi:MAG: hypothetical protein ACRES4_07910 [Nevskiales bacterium]
MPARRVIRRALWVYGLLFMALIGVAGGALAWDFLHFLGSPLAVHESRLLQVAPGSTFNSLSR